jgi:hypothetical protein
VTVAGSVDIGNTPTFNISGTGNTVQLASGTTVEIDTSGGPVDVNLPNVSDMNLTNYNIRDNDLVPLHAIIYTATNWPTGDSNTFWGDGGQSSYIAFSSEPIFPKQFGIYDGIVCLIQWQPSSGSLAPSLQSGLSYYVSTQSGYPVVPAIHVTLDTDIVPANLYLNSEIDGNNTNYVGYWKFPEPSPLNIVGPSLINNSGSSLSGTVYVYCYGIRASVSISGIAKAQVSNTTSSPVAQQPAAGSFHTTSGSNAGNGSTYDYTQTLVSSGNYLSKLWFGGAYIVIPSDAGAQGSVSLYNGSQQLATASGTSGQTVDLSATQYDFGGGIPNNGITLVVSISDYSGYSSGWGPTFATITSTTPPQTVSVVG